MKFLVIRPQSPKVVRLGRILALGLLCVFALTGFAYGLTQLLSPAPLDSSVLPAIPVTAQTEESKTQAEVQQIPWSGWWWPFSTNLSYHLYDRNGALVKYDEYVAKKGQSNPQALAWEKQNHYTDRPGDEWFGHCNGWAAAAVLESEPRTTVTREGIRFQTADLKGLLSEWHFGDPAIAFYGTRYNGPGDDINDIYPHEFHKALLLFIGEKRLPIIMDISGGTQERDNPQVWNYPAYRYEIEYRPDSRESERTHVRCRVWFVNSSHPNYLGTTSETKTYYYWLAGDVQKPTDGMWERGGDGGWNTGGDSLRDHPDFLWYPAKAKNHPVLQAQDLADIIQGSTGGDEN